MASLNEARLILRMGDGKNKNYASLSLKTAGLDNDNEEIIEI